MIEGQLPNKALGLIQEWAILHKQELEKEWALILEGKPLFKIDPLE